VIGSNVRVALEYRVDPLRRCDVVVRVTVGGHGVTRSGELFEELKPLTS
jgi:hypothetical protein